MAKLDSSSCPTVYVMYDSAVCVATTGNNKPNQTNKQTNKKQ